MKIRLQGHLSSRMVNLNEKPLDPKKSHEIRNHSRDGFMWGYGGSGPAQLALAVCLELWGREIAIHVYQIFKSEFISPLPQKNFDEELDLTDFIKKHIPIN